MTDDLNIEISQILDARKDEMSRAIAARHAQGAQAPGYHRVAEDTRYTLTFLSESIALSRPSLFRQYVTWLRSVLLSRGVPEEGLLENFGYIDEALRGALPDEAAERAMEYVQAGRERIQSADIVPPAYLDPGDRQWHVASRYLHHALHWEREEAARTVMNAVSEGVSVPDVLEYILEPCQHEIGRRWQTAKITVAQEHYATSITRELLIRLTSQTARTEARRTVVAACVEGDLHDMGIQFVGAWLQLEDWRVVNTGASTPTAALLDVVRGQHPEILALSATMPWNLRTVAEVIQAIRGSHRVPHVRILVGGGAFASIPDLWIQLMADGYAPNAREAASLVRRLFRRTDRATPR